jgi:hypothetical protein
MTVAVSCNLSDGVVLGVDSAVTIPAGQGVAKVYENAEKLFQIGNRPIGVAFFGLGGLGGRTLGSHLREFEATDPNQVISSNNTMADVVEGLRQFFWQQYQATLVPELEAKHGVPFAQVPANEIPAFGFVIGGFSYGAYLSEIWSATIPMNQQPGSAQQLRGQGNFGTNWFAMFEPIRRYLKGIDQAVLASILTWAQGLLQRPLDPPEVQALITAINGHEYQIPVAAMPMSEGVAFTRFLVDLVISHHKFAIGAAVVGGKARIGRVTYRGERFQILSGQGDAE